MNFVQTGFLVGGIAIAIPIIVHLLSRWQVRRLELGTMRFLREVVQDGAQRRKIRRWLLLLTRIAVVGLLVALFARPFMPTTVRRDGNRLRLILIDRSASMAMPGESGRLVDDAVAKAAEIAAEMGSDATVQWAWFDGEVEPLTDATARVSAPRTVVGDTDYVAALSWARDRLASRPASLADVVVITDLQQTGMATDSAAAESLDFPDDVPVRVVDVGRPAANNLAILAATVPAARLAAGREVTAMVTLFNYGSLPQEEVPLTASAYDGQRTVRLKKSINIPGGEAQEVQFDFGQLNPGRWQITVDLDVADDLAADNRRLSAIEVATPADVLVVDGGFPNASYSAAAESYYLVAALSQGREPNQISGSPAAMDSQPRSAADNNSVFQPYVHYLGEQSLPELNSDRYRLVVVADSGSLSRLEIERLERYVRDGGKLLVFAGDGDGAAGNESWQQSQLAPGRIGSPQRSGAMPFSITAINPENAMLQPFADPQRGDLSRLAFSQILPVMPADSTHVLAEFDPDRAAVTEHALGNGAVVWFLSSADATWSHWTSSPLYLPVVQQLAGDLLNLTGEGPIRFRRIGDPRTDSLSQRRPPQVTPVSRTAAARQSAGPSSADATSFRQPGFERAGETLYVVNAAAKESDPTRVSAEDLAKQFKLTLASGAGEIVPTAVDHEGRNELWPWLAMIVFVLLVAEYGLANRTTA